MTFMSTPLPLIIYIAIYLRFIYFDGVRFMRNRKPYDLSTFIRCYNVFQVFACALFAYKSHSIGVKFYHAWHCIPGYLADSGLDKIDWAWWFIMLRAVEFSETVTFVLRKKQNQVSLLHVYHHISSLVFAYLFFRMGPGIFLKIF